MDHKEEKFIALAETRTQKILDTIDLLGNLSNKANYTFTEQQYRRMFTAIRAGVRDCEARFTGKKADSNRFSLS